MIVVEPNIVVTVPVIGPALNAQSWVGAGKGLVKLPGTEELHAKLSELAEARRRASDGATAG